MERVSQKSPLPCFGLEHNRYDPQCQKCPHFDLCLAHMGSRADKIPLSSLKFDIVPKAFHGHAYDLDDPELPYLQRLFCDCYATVFQRQTTDNISRWKREIASNARKAECSLRLFMLANMVGHEIDQKTQIDHTEKGRASKFSAESLKSDFAVKRAKMYQEMCRDRFGTFSLRSLQTLTKDDKDDLEDIFLHCEITAGQWLVAYKIHNRSPRNDTLLAFYESQELDLDAQWLAMEETYLDLILKPYVDKKTGTERLQRHRFDAFHAHSQYKRQPSVARRMWLMRQSVIGQAVTSVLNKFAYSPTDFLYPREPVRNMIDFWFELGTAIRHNHCWRFLNNESSYFSPRRNAELPAAVYKPTPLR